MYLIRDIAVASLLFDLLLYVISLVFSNRPIFFNIYLFYSNTLYLSIVKGDKVIELLSSKVTITARAREIGLL